MASRGKVGYTAHCFPSNCRGSLLQQDANRYCGMKGFPWWGPFGESLGWISIYEIFHLIKMPFHNQVIQVSYFFFYLVLDLFTPSLFVWFSAFVVTWHLVFFYKESSAHSTVLDTLDWFDDPTWNRYIKASVFAYPFFESYLRMYIHVCFSCCWLRMKFVLESKIHVSEMTFVFST